MDMKPLRKITSETDYIKQSDITNLYTRGIRIGFNYNFGNLKSKTKKKEIKSNDLKSSNNSRNNSNFN